MRVLLVDDHRVFLDSFRLALTKQSSMDVVGQSASAAEARTLVDALRPDLMVLDLMLGDTDAVSLTRQLRETERALKIIVLTVHDNSLFVRDAFDAGVNGYALKEQPLAEVVEAMRVVERGGRYLAPALAGIPIGDAARVLRRSGGNGGAEHDRLSRREREIFGLIVQGSSSRDIAAKLGISLKTVETHRAHINKKLGVRSPAELIRVAALQGLLAQPSG
jgi:DNA-binding NarL/FixJ family response regulator